MFISNWPNIPILADDIRLRMREELFRRGVVSLADFEREIREMAIESQRREGVLEPYTQEEASVWALRQQRIRDMHSDAYFADSLGIALLEQLIQEVLRKQSTTEQTIDLTFNPEIAPWELLFRQGELYEARSHPELKGDSAPSSGNQGCLDQTNDQRSVKIYCRGKEYIDHRRSSPSLS